MKKSFTDLAAVLCFGLTFGGGLQAQTTVAGAPQKSIASEPVAPFASFERWVTTLVVLPVAEASPTQTIQFVAPPAAGTPFQPKPVILGLPDVPLIGDGVAQAASRWGSSFNYQGVQMRLVVVNPASGKRELRSMASGIRAGEVFKVRLISSFDALADVDQLVGEGWSLQRASRVYPATDKPVQVYAGQVIDIPVEPAQYFRFNGDRPSDQVVFSVRHAKADKEFASTQPAYRQDGRAESSYLQLVPRNQYPVIEQVISMRR